MRKNRILVRILVGVLALVGFSMIVVGSTYAASVNGATAIKTKAALEGVWGCHFNKNAYADGFLASKYREEFVKNPSDEQSVKLPYGLTSAVNNNATCEQIMFGWNKVITNNDDLYKGLIPPATTLNSNTKIAEFFAGTDMATGAGGIGYKGTSVNVSGAESVGTRIKYTIDSSSDCGNNKPSFTRNDNTQESLDSITFPAAYKNGSGVAISETGSTTPPVGQTYEYTTSCSGVSFSIRNDSGANNLSYTVYIYDRNYSEEIGPIVKKIYNNDGTWETEAITGNGGSSVFNSNTFSLTAPEETTTMANGNPTTGDYILNFNSPYQMITGLNEKNTVGYKVSGLNGTRYTDLALTRQELYDLYKYYVSDVLEMKVACEGDDNWGLYSGNTPINWKGHQAQCAVYDPGGAKDFDGLDGPMYGVDSADSRHFTRRLYSVNDIASTLMDMGDLCDLSGVEGCSESSGGGTTSSSDRYKDGFCDDVVDENGGIGSMQWILCPALDNTTYTANWIDKITQKALEIDSDIYKPGSKVQTIWENIRNIANVLMVILLLLIVASQVTGYGIDNYGIKKMLPRLIVMAIVINLSYYICVLAVDLSNILGTGLRDMFGALGGDSSTNSLVDAIMGLFGAGATGAGAAVGAGTMAATLGFGGWIPLVIGALVFILVIIVALAVLWLMLGARMVIVIFCIAVSPLAFAAFILPNTQSLFKKWWSLFQAAIIIFPICGAVSGISTALKGVEFNGVFGAAGELILIVLPYLVFFLLPMLLKNAIAGLGKLGGALTNMGNTVRNGGRAIGQAGMKGVQSSERFKDWSNYRQQELAARRARRTYDSLHGQANLSRRQLDRLRKAQDILTAHDNRMTENREQTQGEYMQNKIAKQRLEVGESVRDMDKFGDVEYLAGKQIAGQLNRENEVEDTKLYTAQGYASGKRTADQMSRWDKLDKTRLYNDQNFVTGKMEEQGLSTRNERRRAELYADPRYSGMMNRHGEIAVANEKEKMYSERFADQDKVTNTTAFTNALTGTDAEEAAAAFTTLTSQGINESMGVLYTADWNLMNDAVRDKVVVRMASSNVDSFKSYAKYYQSGGRKSFADWMNGTGVETGRGINGAPIKETSYASHLMDLKGHGMDNFTKDEAEFINKQPGLADRLRAQVGTQEFGTTLMNSALGSKDPKMQTQMEDMIRKQIASGAMTVSDLGITAEKLGTMRGDMMTSIRNGYVDNLKRRGYSDADANKEAIRLIQSGLSKEIAGAKADQRIHNRMDKNVGSVLGM